MQKTTEMTAEMAKRIAKLKELDIAIEQTRNHLDRLVKRWNDIAYFVPAELMPDSEAK